MQDGRKQDAPRKKKRWRTADVLGIVFGSLIAAMLALLIFVDVESLRKPLAAKISEATGYQVEIQTLALSFYPRLGIKVGGLQVLSESWELFSAESLFVEAELKSLRRFFSSSFKEGATKFELQRVRINEIDLAEITGSLVLSRENIQLTQCRIFPEHGEVRLTGNYKMDLQSFNTEFSAKNLRAEDFLGNNLSGSLQLAGQLQGPLNEAVAIKGLSGKINVKFADGRILISDFLEKKRRDGFAYEYINGDVVLSQGVLSTDNWKLEGNELKLAAKGKLDLPTRRVGGEVEVTLPFLNSYYNVAGTLDELEIQLDSSKSVLFSPEKILEGILNITESLLSGGK